MLVYNEIGASMVIFPKEWYTYNASNMCWIGQNNIATYKLKQLLLVCFLIDIAYTANNILYKLYTKMVVYF